jgi:hypothetical protein
LYSDKDLDAFLLTAQLIAIDRSISRKGILTIPTSVL